ncbi:MerR family transcriptional regulator [Lysinibacillus contaminans]|uniref:MerR family transcriptional regulator n=1 Tax=Lysinibacillus contaminans TaxID=1293441 RepID=A0ABR5K4S7_9BACI|nr:MerR family DNA-binding transcriptional regulator [Lysinibacillus contaminans]KOS69717.1 MerR family transcriptional regulator [Lysinibacillus contaminans]
MNDLFSIGEVAKIKGITIKALRYYHKVGILIPRYIDESTGYRYYSLDQFIYIDVIKGCRVIGVSIAELQEVFKKCDIDELLEFLKIKKYEAQENINKMKEVIKNIDDFNSFVEHSVDILNNKEINIEVLEERYIIFAPCNEVGSLKELLYYSNLDKVITENNLEMTMERGIIYNFNINGDVEPIYVFNGLKQNYSIEVDDNIMILPRGKYLTLAYSKDDEKENINKILNYIKVNNINVKSCIEVELLNEFLNTEYYSCQIQMLIEEN